MLFHIFDNQNEKQKQNHNPSYPNFEVLNLEGGRFQNSFFENLATVFIFRYILSILSYRSLLIEGGCNLIHLTFHMKITKFASKNDRKGVGECPS